MPEWTTNKIIPKIPSVAKYVKKVEWASKNVFPSKTFKIGDKVKRRDVQPAGTNSVSVKIEYSDGTIIENGLSTIKIGKKEYHLIYAKAPACYMKIRDFCWN